MTLILWNHVLLVTDKPVVTTMLTLEGILQFIILATQNFIVSWRLVLWTWLLLDVPIYPFRWFILKNEKGFF